MSFTAKDIASLTLHIAEVIADGRCEWFFDFEESKWACLIGSDVFLFSRGDGDSITFQYQNRRLLFLKDTDGWEGVSGKLREMEKINPDDLPHGDLIFERAQANIRLRVLEAVANRVAAIAKVG